MNKPLDDLQNDRSNSSLGHLMVQLGIGEEVDWGPSERALSAWLEHIPFAFWLVQAVRPRTFFVELGTHFGASYFAFCQAVDRLSTDTRCYAVDTWKGDEHSGHYDEDVYWKVVGVNNRLYRKFSSLLRMTFADALGNFKDGEIDLLHIDGFHTYEAVSIDFHSWRTKLSRKGIVLFHDLNVRENNFGVWKLWEEIKREFPHFEFDHGYGLGVLGVGDQIPVSVSKLFAMTDRDAAGNFFAARGSAVENTWRLKSARDRIDALEGSVRSAKTSEAELSQLRVDRDGLEAELRIVKDGELASLRSEREELLENFATSGNLNSLHSALS